MCDHCAKVISQKRYAGQVTCRCAQPEKKIDVEKEKDFAGCCSKKAREAAGGCCMSGCCKQYRNGKGKKDSASVDCTTQIKDEGCCGNQK